MHVPHFKTWIVFMHVASCLVTCGSSSGINVFNNDFSGLPRAKNQKVYQETISHKSLDANMFEEKVESQMFEDGKKLSGVVENAGNDLYMVRSVINGDGKITGSSVSVLSKDNIDLNKGQVSGLSFENRLDKTSKTKYQPRSNYYTKFDETMSPLMDEPSKVSTTDIIGVVGFPIEFPCDVQPAVEGDQLLLILWFKEGYPSPIYSFDVRGKSIMNYASHYTDDNVFGQRAKMRVPMHRYTAQLHLNNQGIQHNIVAVLEVENLRQEDNGIYKCRADFKKSPTKNHRFRLSVLIPPNKPIIRDENGKKMTKNLGPYKIGDKLFATCSTTGGNPPPRLAWYKGHELIDDSYEQLNGRTTNILTLVEPVHKKDAGKIYTCQAVNNNQSIPVATKLKLEISYPPKSVRLLGNRSRKFSSGRMEKLECESYGSQPAPKFKWYVGSRELQMNQGNIQDERLFIKTEENFVTGSFAQEERKEFVEGEEVAITTGSIRFIPTIDDNGKYISCRVTNTYFPEITKEDGYIITVNYIPMSSLSFGRSLSPKNILSGADVYFECHVKANPPFYNITWRQNGKFLIENRSKGIIIGNQTLVLQKVNRHQAGLYTCVASNQEGDGESNAQYLDVKYSPICQLNQRILYGTARRSETKISCKVDANPMPTNFHWQFKTANVKGSRGSLINNPNIGDGEIIDLIKDMEDLPSNSYTIDNDESLLTYGAITEADYGYVYCWAENEIAKQDESCRFEVVKESAPEPLANCRAVNVTWENVETRCIPGFDGGHPLTFVLEVYLIDEDLISSPNENSHRKLPSGKMLVYNLTSSDAPHFQIAGLSPGTKYQFAGYAHNIKGQSAKILFNVTTLNLAEKRTAETRTKVGAVINDKTDAEQESFGIDLNQNRVDPGLALLPIIAILCGVALGLGTIGLGVVLLIRGRGNGMGSDQTGPNRRNDSLSGSTGSNGATPTKYDVYQSNSSTLSRDRSGHEGEHFAMQRSIPQGCESDIEVNVLGHQSLSRHYPSRHYHNTGNQCDTSSMSNKKGIHPDNKGIVSILTPTDGNAPPSVISHISSMKDSTVTVDSIQLVSNPNKKDYVISRQQPRHLHSYASTVTVPTKTYNIRCHQNDDGANSDTSSIPKSVHFEKLPYLQKEYGMENVPLLNHYNAASSASSNLHILTKSQHTSNKCSDMGIGHSQSLHRQHSHHPTSYQHSNDKSARSTIREHNHKSSSSELDASSSNEISEQLTLRPPATFSDLNPISEVLSSFQGRSQNTPLANQQIGRVHPPSSNLSSVMTSNQHGSVAEVVEKTKSSEFSNTSVESLLVTFCSPNLETKSRDIVNATRL